MNEEASVLVDELRNQALRFDQQTDVQFVGKYPPDVVQRIRDSQRKHPKDHNHDRSVHSSKAYESGLFERKKAENRFQQNQIDNAFAEIADQDKDQTPDQSEPYEERNWRGYLHKINNGDENEQPKPRSDALIQYTLEEKILLKKSESKKRFPRR